MGRRRRSTLCRGSAGKPGDCLPESACADAGQVIPFTAGARTGLLGAFVIATLDGDGSTVYLETATTGQVVEVPSATREAALIFDNLRGEALPRTASRDLIMKEAQERWT
jgi:uncharacterized protein DUF5753